MVTQSAEVDRTEGREIGSAVRAIGGLVLALALAAVLGGRQLVQQRDAGTAATPPAERGVAPAPAGAAIVFTVYLVGSEEHASSVRASLEDADRIRESLGGSPSRYAVVVVGSEDAIAVEEAVREDARGRPMRVVDLRASP
jgi:hypothetical protein